METKKVISEPGSEDLQDRTGETDARARAWWDLSVDASMWWRRKDVRPRDAAMLLCRLNPLSDSDPECITTDKTSPRDFQRLLVAFEDIDRASPRARTLAEWLELAQREGLKYHPWIDEFVAAEDVQAEVSYPGEESAMPTGKVHRMGTRRDVLHPVLAMAIKKAGGADPAGVYVALREMALRETPPFNGEVEGDVLFYCNAKNEVIGISKRSIMKRVRRLGSHLE